MNLKEKKIASKTIYKGKILRLEVDDVLCPNGQISQREVVRHTHAACILAFKDENTILIEKQFRYPYNEIIFELPAGKMDADEDMQTTALRELEEETGFLARTIQYLGKIYPACAYTDEIIHLFLAKDLIKTKQSLDADESLEILEMKIDEVVQMIKDGKLFDAKSLCAILHYLISRK